MAPSPTAAGPSRRRVLAWAVYVWMVVGAAVALAAMPAVNPDARPLVVTASLLGPLAAWAAARRIRAGRTRRAGGLLVGSALITPTYYLYPINLVVLAMGLTLVIIPRVAVDPSREADPARRTPVTG